MARILKWILLSGALLLSGLSAQALLEPPAQAAEPIVLVSLARPSLAVVEQWTTQPVATRRGTFTGVFVDAPKVELPWILTVISTIAEEDSFRILIGRTMAKATLVGYDHDTKLALLEMDHAVDRPHVSFNSPSPTPEQATLPLFMVEGGSPGNEPATAGRFACREPLSPLSPSLLRVHIAAREGCGGAPLYDERQQLIGLISSPVAGVAECFHALPAERISKFLRDVRKHGKAVESWLGIILDERITAPRILGRRENSPAQQAGLEAGDLILSVGGINVPSLQHLIDACSVLDADAEVELKIMRGREILALKITPKIRSVFTVS